MSTCLNCGKETSNPKYCSCSCAGTANNKLFPKRRLKGKCLACSKPIPTTKNFCDDCCSDGKHTPYEGRIPHYKDPSSCDSNGKLLSGQVCSDCQYPLTIYNKTGRCKSCYTKYHKERLNNTTKSEIFSKHHDQTARILIRRHCFKTFTATCREFVCVKCGYKKHAEVCHIQSISSFPDSATLGEINHPNNLITLCPNCHWEYDNGLLTL